MPLNIKDSETDALVRQLAALTGESITEAVFVIEQADFRVSNQLYATILEFAGE